VSSVLPQSIRETFIYLIYVVNVFNILDVLSSLVNHEKVIEQ